MLLPFLLLLLHSRVAYWPDLDAFARWSTHQPRHGVTAAPAGTFSALYRDTDCNYPPLGMIASAGLITAIKTALHAVGSVSGDSIQIFRVCLAAVEAVSIVLMLSILTTLHVPHVSATVAALYLLPSSWAGGAVWGQIDVVGTVLLLAAALCFLRVALADASTPRDDELTMVAGLAAVVAAVETKQTTLFSVPGLLTLASVAIVAFARRHGTQRAARALAIGTAVALVLFVVLERGIFDPPAGHDWITPYVWTTGAPHTRRLSGNGPNVWTLLGRRLLSSSDAPFVGSLTPRRTGQAMFVAVVTFLLIVQLAAIRSASQRIGRFTMDRTWLCGTTLVLTGLTNLAMGIFIAGTHERHLAHAFPFLLLGVVTLYHHDASPRSRTQLAIAVVAAVVYGGVVYAVLLRASWLDLRFPAIILLAAFLALATGYTQTVAAHRRRRLDAAAPDGGALV